MKKKKLTIQSLPFHSIDFNFINENLFFHSIECFVTLVDDRIINKRLFMVNLRIDKEVFLEKNINY